jgi:hypothetical protein
MTFGPTQIQAGLAQMLAYVPSLGATLIDAHGEAYPSALVTTTTIANVQGAAGETARVTATARVPVSAYRIIPEQGDVMTLVKAPAGGRPEDRQRMRVQADVLQDPTGGMWTIPLGPEFSAEGLT